MKVTTLSVVDFDNERPYGSAAWLYLRAGWLPIPLKGKRPLIAGYTGRDGQDPSKADVAHWVEIYPKANIGLRLPADVVGIDVDAYGDKRGAETLAALEAQWGPLPATWVSTSRDDGISGIYWFAKPEPVEYRSHIEIGGIADIEIIQRHHRYAVVAPSVHPTTGSPYRWVAPDGSVADRIPSLEDLRGML